MKVAVTGASGFVGGALIAAIRAEGVDALALVRQSTGAAMEIAVGDLSTAQPSPEALEKIDAIIHLAARAHVMKDHDADPLSAYRAINVRGTRNILEAAAAAGVKRFVYVSSIKACAERSTPGSPLTERTPETPEDAYGISKLEAEKLVAETASQNGMEWTVVRPPLVYGPNVRGNFERLIALANRQLPLPFGAINNRRSIISLDNLTAALVAACRSPDVNTRKLMLADDCLSTPALLRAIGQALGRPQRLLPVPVALLLRGGGMAGRRAVISRLCESLEIDAAPSWQALGVRPSKTTAESMDATVDAWRAQVS